MPRRRAKKNSVKLINMIQPQPSAPSEYTYSLQRSLEFNGKIYSYIQNFNLLSEKEQEELKDSCWFQAGLQRSVVTEILLQLQPGSFIIRQSESASACFALSMRIPATDKTMPKLAHYLIEKTPNGYRFKGFLKEFALLKSLVVHHSIIKGHLPVPLVLSRAQDFAMSNLVIDVSSESESELHEKNKSTSCFCKN